MYGTQTSLCSNSFAIAFENDVKMYGTQTIGQTVGGGLMFENDVKMYGTQTSAWFEKRQTRLRMM